MLCTGILPFIVFLKLIQPSGKYLILIFASASERMDFEKLAGNDKMD